MIVVAVVVAAIGFFGGMKYQQSKQPSFFGRSGGVLGTRAGTGQTQGNRAGFRPVNGEIISTDDKSITVKLTDGSSKIILLSDKTIINTATQASKSALISGEKVGVFGTENSDGSVIANTIQLNPNFRGQGK